MPAPDLPAAYQEALVTASTRRAAALAAGRDPVAVTAKMSEYTAAAREKAAGWVKPILHALFAIDPYNAAQVGQFAVKAAQAMAAAQTAAGRAAAAAQVHQLAAVGVRVDARPTLPVDVRAPAAKISRGKLHLDYGPSTVEYANGGTAHITAADMTTEAVFKRPAAAFRWAESEGRDGAAAAGLRMDKLVDDQLMLAQRLAQQQVIVQAVDLDQRKDRQGPQPVIIGYRRVIHPELSRTGTCGLCIAAADRVYNVAELMPIHDRCHCTIAAITEDHDPADDVNAADLRQLYEDAGGTSAAHLKKTRYKHDQHGELGQVLVPIKGYDARGPLAKQSAASGAGTEAPKTATMSDQASNSGHLQDAPARTRNGMSEEHKPETAAGTDVPPIPPTQNKPAAAGDEDPHDRLGRLFSEQTAKATPAQRAAVVRWQGMDRYYEKVQEAIGGAGDAAARTVVQELSKLARPLPEDTELWRGIRSIPKTFDVASDDVASIVGRQWIEERFMGATVSKDKAMPEFTHPGPAPAILRITARAGAPAVWIPPLGDPKHARQSELLFMDGVRVRILGVDTSGAVPVITMEVT
ncbi:hypothetical protein [Mycolicibacterium brisbanense]